MCPDLGTETLMHQGSVYKMFGGGCSRCRCLDVGSYGAMDVRSKTQALNQQRARVRACVIDGRADSGGYFFQGPLHLPAIMMHGRHQFTGPSHSSELFMTVCVCVWLGTLREGLHVARVSALVPNSEKTGHVGAWQDPSWC